MESNSRSERRRAGRFRKALRATCQINGISYEACTYDINQQGIALLAPPTLPNVSQFIVRCVLPNGTSSIFEVRECHRAHVTRRSHRFLRLGLILTNETTDNLAFFRILAATVPQSLHGDPAEILLRSRLPATAWVDNTTFSCETLNVALSGLQLKVPGNFPKTGVFPLTCHDEKGGAHHLTVHEVSRHSHLQGDELYLGCEVLGNQEALRGLVERL